jgi:ribonuclease E
MANKMLIDATHPEETRVVVVRGSRVEEFDFEAASKKQLRGNIYLAKVTRVEPSLQAAFVDYGGNRHGFLAFAEIHPDYYQIPYADRQALLEEEARMHSESEREENRPRRARPQSTHRDASDVQEGSVSSDETGAFESGADDSGPEEAGADASYEDNGFEEIGAESASVDDADAGADGPEIEEFGGDGSSSGEHEGGSRDRGRGRGGRNHQRSRGGRRDEEDDHDGEADQVEVVGSEDALEELPERRPGPKLRRHYKIQEVIKRRQVLLVQVVKEERGNKGAALTTYLSLAGRYSVLMPNTARGGGISRKITNIPDRKRLKTIAQELEVPEGMGVIVRTAGAARTKVEIKRDFEYLLRLWENVRELTLQSTAPKLVYEEGSLIKRSIRDLYNKDIDEVIVAGDEGYREAKDFMRMLMPSHSKNVVLYRELSPVFTRYGVESQLDAMFSPQVTLRSGGYIVINQTEALVSIDVNSGKSTREHNIEDTALATNMEAAEEVARQLRLRDLAGLVVIDFIDMEEKRNDRSVERRLKDCLKNDRARIQVGRISHFGLMEMSRQRIRSGVLEASMVICHHCGGTGLVRSTESVALHVLRAIEESLLRGVTHDLIVRTRSSATLYILNQKRAHLADLERRFGLSIMVLADDHAAMNGHLFAIERGEPVTQRVVPMVPQSLITPLYDEPEYEEPEYEEEIGDEEEELEANLQADDIGTREVRREGPRQGERGADRSQEGEGGRRKRRRRRRGRGRGPEGEGTEGQTGERTFQSPAGEFVASEAFEPAEGYDDAFEPNDGELTEAEANEPLREGETAEERANNIRKRRRRGRRGGRRNRREGEEGGDHPAALADDGAEGSYADEGHASESVDETTAPTDGEAIAGPVDVDAADFVAMDGETLTTEVEVQLDEAAKPAKKPRAPRKPRLTKAAAAAAEAAALAEAAAAEAGADVSSSEAPAQDAPAPVHEPEPTAEPAPVATAPEPVEPPPPPKPELISTETDPAAPKKAGWWSKKIFGG